MIPGLTDAQICGTLEKLADALPESDLLNRLRLNELLAEFARLQSINAELTAELARRPRVMVASNELVPVRAEVQAPGRPATLVPCRLVKPEGA